MRDAFGLRSGHDGTHWQDDDNRSDVLEACVLLTHPVSSVRGFLATARREAEAGW